MRHVIIAIIAFVCALAMPVSASAQYAAGMLAATPLPPPAEAKTSVATKTFVATSVVPTKAKPKAVKKFLKKTPKAPGSTAISGKTLADKTAVDMFVFEAMWRSGAPEYQAVVNGLAVIYAEKMGKMGDGCHVIDDFDAVISAYGEAFGVYAPPGTEAVRDRFMKKMIVTLARVSKYADGAKRVAKLQM